MSRAPCTIVAWLLWLTLAGACVDPSPGPAARLAIDDAQSSDGWQTVAAGTYNSCATGPGGAAFCWGFAIPSQCGDGGCAVSATPTRLGGSPAAFDTVASGGGFHCGIAADRSAWCWGEAPATSLGDGFTVQSATPVRVAVDPPIRAIATGYSSACALREEGTVWCWGHKIGAQPDDPLEERIWKLPRVVETELRFTSITVGLSACALTADGTGHCWGGGYGALGAGDRDFACATSESCLVTEQPVPIDGGKRWKSINAGSIAACGVTTDDRGYCWGAIPNLGDPNPPTGILGTGEFTGSKSPLSIAGDLRFASIVVGTRHACGIALDGRAWCWGSNGAAELGTGTSGGRFAAPREVVGGLEFTSLALADHSCGLTINRNLYCWGVTYGGALGIGVIGPGVRPVPVRVRVPAA